MSEAAGTSYTPGSWFGIVGENATVLLPPSEKARAGSLWALVDDGGGFDEVLDALVSTGLRTLPGFVLVAKQDDVTRVVVRGAATATFETADGQVDVDGSGAATWAERSLTDVSSMKIDLGEESDGTTHVVTGGLVRVSGLQVPPPAPPTAPPPAAPPVAAAPVSPAEESAGEPTDEPAEEQGGFQPPALSVVPPPPPGPTAPPAAPVPPSHDPLTDPLTDSFSAPLPYDEAGDRDGSAEAEPDATDEPDAVEEQDGPDEPTDVPYAWGDDVPRDRSVGAWESTANEETDQETGEDTADPDEALTADGPVVGDDEFDAHVGSAPGFPPPPPGFPPPPAAPPAAPSAPVPPPPPPGFTPSWGTPPPPPPAPEQIGEPEQGADAPGGDDHDGLTRAGAPAAGDFSRPAAGIPGQPEAPKVTAYAVARLEFSSGDRVDVDRAVLVGRAPEAGRRDRDDQPLLVTVPSPHQEISSTHCEIRPGTGVDHGAAVVTDLGSTNGTVLVQPGLPPEELRPGVPVQLMPGAVVDLGDGLTIRVSHP